MADINLEAVAGKLNRIGYEAFFKALRQAKGAGNRNVELAHWLVHLLQGERTDIALTADHFKLDRNKLLMDINGAIAGFRKNETEMPTVSNTVMDLLDRVGTQVTTLGAAGVRITRKGASPLELHAAKDVVAHEPTGVGDAFRAGFLAALAWGLSEEHAAQVGCVLAAYVVETVGPQDYAFTAEEFLARLDHSYGGDAASSVEPFLTR